MHVIVNYVVVNEPKEALMIRRHWNMKVGLMKVYFGRPVFFLKEVWHTVNHHLKPEIVGGDIFVQVFQVENWSHRTVAL